MSIEHLTTPFPDARTLLKKYGVHAKKSWGQNFLVSERVYRAIVDATVKSSSDWVIEIGGGLGTLTMRLAQRLADGQLVTLEREPEMLHVLRSEFRELDNVVVHEADALQYDFSAIAKWCGGKVSVCGNLPYQIASQILFRILDNRAILTSAVVMLQKEMADRLTASPGTKAYGALTVIITAYADITTVIQAKADAFLPVPRVDSTVVELTIRDEPRAPISNHSTFTSVVHAAFAQRRKTLRNSLQSQYEKNIVLRALQHVGIDGGRRGETLSVEEFASLTDAFALLFPS